MLYRGRKAVQIENDQLRVTVLVEGGHVAELFHKASGINPLWTPPWRTIEPSTYSLSAHPEYGHDSESRLLAGIMGHNLCLDIFGPPSAQEAAAGLTVHGEASVVVYEIEAGSRSLKASAKLPLAGLHLTRLIELPDEGLTVQFTETVENLSAFDRPVAWTQHVTLGPPFLENGETQFELQPTHSRTFETGFGGSGLALGQNFAWPMAPLASGAEVDLSTYTSEPSSAKFTTHLFTGQAASFTAVNPSTNLRFGYRWNADDFPWLGIWEENRSRTDPPWNRETVTCGFEFGVSPFPETRRQMIERGRLFGVPAYRWIAAGQCATVKYSSFFGDL